MRHILLLLLSAASALAQQQLLLSGPTAPTGPAGICGRNLSVSNSHIYFSCANYILQGTAQGGSPTTIILATSASSVDGTYAGMMVNLSGGPGYGQNSMVTAYSGSSRTATVSPSFNSYFGGYPTGSTTYFVGSGYTEVHRANLDGSGDTCISCTTAAATVISADYNARGFTGNTGTNGPLNCGKPNVLPLQDNYVAIICQVVSNNGTNPLSGTGPYNDLNLRDGGGYGNDLFIAQSDGSAWWAPPLYSGTTTITSSTVTCPLRSTCYTVPTAGTIASNGVAIHNASTTPGSATGDVSDSTLGGIINPTFSPDGTKLCWSSQTNNSSPSAYHTFDNVCADFSIVSGVPTLANVTHSAPSAFNGTSTVSNYYREMSEVGPNYVRYIATDHSTTNSTDNAAQGVTTPPYPVSSYYVFHSCVAPFNPITNAISTCTYAQDNSTPAPHYLNWIEFPRSLWNDPLNRIYYMMTPTAYYAASGQYATKFSADLWMANADGSNPQQLTFNASPGSPQYVPLYSANSAAYAEPHETPDGTKMFAWRNRGLGEGGGAGIYVWTITQGNP